MTAINQSNEIYESRSDFTFDITDAIEEVIQLTKITGDCCDAGNDAGNDF